MARGPSASLRVRRGRSSFAEQELNGPRPFAHAQGTEGKELLRGAGAQWPEALRGRVLNEVKDLAGQSSNGPRPFAFAQGTEGKELLRGVGAQRPEALRSRSGYEGKEPSPPARASPP